MQIVLDFLIKYTAEKTPAYAQLNSAEINKRLKPQLSALKMQHPKSDNVYFVPGEGTHFFWVTEKDSPHHKNMIKAFQNRTKAALWTHFIEDIEMSVRPAPTLGAPLPSDPRISIQPPLVLPTASQGNDLNTNAFPAVAEEGEIEMRDQAQEFLDALKLCPFEALEERVLSGAVPAETLRASSIASSIQSSHYEPLESVAPGVVEEMSVPDVGNFSRVSSPGSISMVISPSPDLSPIPGLAALPMVQDPNTERDFMLDVQHVPKESDSPTILQLSMALQGVRKEIEADLIKEQAILLALKNLDVDVSELVDPSPDPVSPESDFIAKVRVEMLRTELEKMLERRRAVELSIREIAMERRPPFVSPALMDTFVGISRLSTLVLGDDD